MIGIEVTGGLEKDRELADEIVWWCMDMFGCSSSSCLDIDCQVH